MMHRVPRAAFMARRRVLAVFAVLAVLAAAISGCGASSSSSAPPPSPASTDAAGSAPGSAHEVHDKEWLNRPPPTKDVEVKNLCLTGVPVYIGDVPNGTTGDHLVLRGGGTSHFPRRPDGTFTIWLEDDRGYGLAKVHVKRSMSRVEIGASCKTLHAE